MASRLDQLKNAMEVYKGSGNNEFFTLVNDEDATVGRLLYETEDQLDWFVVHEVQIAGKKRWLLCSETPDCPCCRATGKPQLKLFLQLIDSRDNEVKVRTWERGQKFIPKILGLFPEFGPLVNRPYEIVRKGKAGDSNTDYDLIALEPDGLTLEALKAKGYERQEFVGTDGFILKKTIAEMQQIVQGTYQYQAVNNANAAGGQRAYSGPGAGQRTSGPSFGGAPLPPEPGQSTPQYGAGQQQPNRFQQQPSYQQPSNQRQQQFPSNTQQQFPSQGNPSQPGQAANGTSPAPAGDEIF